MAAGRRFELQSLGWDVVELRVCVDCAVGELAGDLLVSKAAVARVLARGQLRRDGQPLSRDQILRPNELVTLELRRDASPAQTNATGPALDVLFCDPVMMVVDKPAGILVHGDGTGAQTLSELAGAWLAQEGHGDLRPQAVQRLDVDTTGLVLFSLAEEFQPALDAQVAGHAMAKRYLAVTRKAPAGAQRGWVDLTGPIARDRHDARRMRVGRSGKPAHTRVRELARASGRILLELELVTGRRHQIRVHLSHAGCPIVGDTLYGGEACTEGLMLHAWQECILHPLTGERLALRSAWPSRFGALFPEDV